MADEKVKTKDEQSLEDFGWDDGVSFFDIENETDEVDVVTKVQEEEDDEDLEKKAKSKKTEPEKTPKAEDDKTKDDDEENDDPDAVFDKSKKEAEKFFEDDDPNKPKGETEDEDEPEEVNLIEFLTTEVLQNVELEEGEEITPERVVELVQAEKEAFAEEVIEGFKEDAGEEGVAFIKHVTAGGDPKEFFNLYREEMQSPEVDLETEEGQDSMLTYYLENFEKLDREDIKDRLEWLSDNGKKKKYAEKAQSEVTEYFEESKKELAKKTKEATELLQQKRKEVSDNLKTKLSETEKIGNYSITKEDKKKLLSDITKTTVKIGPNKFITPLQAKIGEMFKDPEKLILLAKVVMSDFDTTDIEVETASRVTKKVKKKLSTSAKTKLSSQPKSRNRNLSDFFD